jgi:hypothetical protein
MLGEQSVFSKQAFEPARGNPRVAVEKCLHAKPGDVLIDDWEKYRQLWVNAGGHWITQRGAAATADELSKLGL